MNDLPADDDALLTLEDAASLMFPAGTVTAKTLQRKIRQGKLVAYRVGKPFLTTRRDVKAMIALTKVQPKQRAAPEISAQLDETLANAALDAALALAQSKPRRR